MKDVHTHIGEYPQHMSEGFVREARAAWPDLPLGVVPEQHYSATRCCEQVVVLGFQARHVGWVVPNDYVADYVSSDPERLIGFGSVDPLDPHAPQEVERMAKDLGLRGCKLAPIYQGADPLDTAFDRIFAACERNHLPVLIHQGASFVRDGPLLHSRPVLVDEIARRYPALPIVIAHMGHPWCAETVAVIRKQPNVYADVSALHPRPWQLYQALLSAVEYGAAGKLLLGSDYPFFTIEETVAGLRSVNQQLDGTGLPRIPSEVIEDVIQRDGTALLGIA